MMNVNDENAASLAILAFVRNSSLISHIVKLVLIHFMNRLTLSSAELKRQEYTLQWGKHYSLCRFKGLRTYH